MPLVLLCLAVAGGPGGEAFFFVPDAGAAPSGLGPAMAAKGGGRARGKGADIARAAVPRQRRMTDWGARTWSIGETVHGWGADCRCHRDAKDSLSITHCKKNLPRTSLRATETDDDLRRLAKVWLLVGLDMSDVADNARSLHVAVNPREHYVGFSEAQLDDLSSSL